MTTYVIGDIQGCFDQFHKLLELIRFDPSKDQLWLTGDLVNRGPDNVNTLRFIRELGISVVAVQGNHDLHLLAVVFGGHSVQQTDTFHDVIAAEDCEQLCHWLSKFPLLHYEQGHILVHAGLPHIWSLAQAERLAREVHDVLCGPTSKEFFRRMYGNEPSLWSDSLRGMDRLRAITNYLTRMRCIGPEGQLTFEHELGEARCPDGYQPWFDYPPQFNEHIVFGHWASLGGKTHRSKFHAVDTGCVWGRHLTALRLSDHQRFSVALESV
ncbi:MAG: symmetrical bis(5'-nucleosyl)-tetraphosphatase [Gammaproteobacteria bacterium]|nr:symmetrical bis(5'-nucleosyl)-tetraphosphatase [Gammaproteobacteria bacterium]MYF37414.1 symmetrical bis(5'-nucleosyl)-tetraphosphatase [Gammaproteobacteria bacterium]